MTSHDAGDQRLGAGGIETNSFEGKRPGEMRSLPIVGYGMNGDPLRQGKLDLPELLESPTPDECDWARKFIARRRWREAITYRKTAPHEYTVREWEIGEQANQDFDQFTVFVRRFGYADFFYRVRHLYWVLDDFKYWTISFVGWFHSCSGAAFRSQNGREPNSCPTAGIVSQTGRHPS